MSGHWTYESIGSREDHLAQGDILTVTQGLKELLREVDPQFCDPKHLAFIVTTQTCDLVRRKGEPCKAHYINLAAVRSLEFVLSDLLDRVCKPVLAVPSQQLYLNTSKKQAYQLLERIFNQNEQAFGLFYLHPDPDNTGIHDFAVALLRLTVSVRATEHYEVLREARTGRLAKEFRNKLGWLVGNLYSRIGTQDWADQENGEKQLRKMIDDLLDSGTYKWVDPAGVKCAERAGEICAGLSSEELMVILEKHRPPPFKDQIAREARRELDEMLPGLARDVEAALRVKRDLSDILLPLLNNAADKLQRRLANNQIVSRAIDRTSK